MQRPRGGKSFGVFEKLKEGQCDQGTWSNVVSQKTKSLTQDEKEISMCLTDLGKESILV